MDTLEKPAAGWNANPKPVSTDPESKEWADYHARNDSNKAVETNPGTKPNATLPVPDHPNPDAVGHAFIRSADDKKEGGKEMGLVHAPIVSMHATSAKQDEAGAKIGEHTIVEKANFKLNHYLPELGHVKFNYPFEGLTIGQGMFIPVEKGRTTDALMTKLHSQVDKFRKQNSEIERDENGDDVMEDVAINVKKRNDDGTVQLDGNVPRLTIKSGFRPKLVGPNFVVKSVVKDDEIGENNKAVSDGALVIRLS